MRTSTLAGLTAVILAIAGCLANGGNLRVDRDGPGPDTPKGGGVAPAATGATETAGTAQTGVGAVGKVLDASGSTGFALTQVMPWALSALLGLFLLVNGFTVKRAVATANSAVAGAFHLCESMLQQSNDRELARIALEADRLRTTKARANAVDSAATAATVAVAATTGATKG